MLWKKKLNICANTISNNYYVHILIPKRQCYILHTHSITYSVYQFKSSANVNNAGIFLDAVLLAIFKNIILFRLCNLNNMMAPLEVTTVPHRNIPTDLFPLTSKEYNIQWARKTYKFAPLFDNNKFPSTIFDTGDDLQTWILVAGNIVEE